MQTTRLETTVRGWLDSPFRQWWTSTVVGLVVALGSAFQLWVNWRQSGFQADLSALFASKAVEWVAWAAVVPIAVSLDRRTRFQGIGWARRLALHLALATGWFLALNAPLAALTAMVDPAAAGTSFGSLYLSRIAYRLPSAWVVYGFILGAARLMTEFVRSQRLSRDLAQAQLRVLRDQLQPHFLFNALHTAGGLVRSGDRDGAVDTLVALSDLLRRSLGYAREDEVTLEEELDFLDRYLAIQRRRFGDRLEVDVDVPPELGAARVPPFLLQPLVENAIRHGLDLDHGTGTVAIRGQATPGAVILTVEDSGGCADGWPQPDESEGIGLANLRGRLSRHYGATAGLETSVTDGLTRVTLTLPVRP
jgi:hypothetical protein